MNQSIDPGLKFHINRVRLRVTGFSQSWKYSTPIYFGCARKYSIPTYFGSTMSVFGYDKPIWLVEAHNGEISYHVRANDRWGVKEQVLMTYPHARFYR